MGLSIGHSAAAITALTGIRGARPTSLFDRAERSSVRLLGQKASDVPILFRESDPKTVRVGLGTGASSGPAAALNVLSRTVERAKGLVPSIAELEVGFRRSASESRAQIRKATLPSAFDKFGEAKTDNIEFERNTSNRVEFRLPNPSVQARNFINALNDVAGELQARFAGEDTAPKTGATFRFGDQTFPVRDTSSGFHINITV
jgi:hypothetical protein